MTATRPFRILVTENLSSDALARLRGEPDVAADFETGLSAEQLLAIIPQYDGLIVRGGTAVTAELLAASDRLRIIGRAGAGVENIDIKTATRRGIVVMNTPGVNSIATAEMTIALMLAASRHLPQAHASLAAGEWRRDDFAGGQLHRKVLGVIGFGRVGKLVVERAQAFGMEVLVYDPAIMEETARDRGVLLVELDELLEQADYITLHAAATPATRNMVNAEAIAQMKDGAILVNAARGQLVDELALAVALRSGKLAAAAVDVYAAEPPAADHPLIGLPNVVHTPHIGAVTREAWQGIGTQIVRQVVSALRGTDYAYAVNMPSELQADFARVRPYVEMAETIGRLQAALADKPIRRVEIEARGDVAGGLIRAIGVGVLKGILAAGGDETVNYVNTPVLAHERGLTTTQAVGLNDLDYPNLVACKAVWDGGARLLAGVLFADGEPRIVQIDQYRLEARAEGIVLIMQNKDVPGVIGQVGTLLANHAVNIGEWRLGRIRPGSDALSFINLDSEPGDEVLAELAQIAAVAQFKVVRL